MGKMRRKGASEAENKTESTENTGEDEDEEEAIWISSV
jgi:hypothetical protein